MGSNKEPNPDELENVEHCLICSSSLVPLTDENVPQQVPPYLGHKCKTVSEQLWTIFLLNKLLQLPQLECEKLLKNTYGLNPTSWFRVCDNCCGIVKEGIEVYTEIVKLERKLDKFRQTLNEKIIDSIEFEKENFPSRVENGFIFSARTSIRISLSDQLGTSTKKSTKTCGKNNSGEVDEAYPNDAGEVDEVYSNHSGSGEVDGVNSLYSEEEEEVTTDYSADLEIDDTDFDFSDDDSDVNFENTTNDDIAEAANDTEFLPKTTSSEEHLCDTCGRSFKKLASLRRHRTRKHGIVKTANDLKTPPKTKSGEHLCDACGIGFITRRNLRIHETRMHLSKKKYKCVYCSEGFSVKLVQQKHEDSCMNNDDRKVPGQRKRVKKDKIVYDKVSSKMQSPKCPKCPHLEPFLNFAFYKAHVKAEHKDKYNFSCDMCDKSYTKMYDLNIHIESSHTPCYCDCPYCGKTKPNKLFLKRHVKICPKKPKE